MQIPNPYNYLLSPPIYKRPCSGNHYSKCPKSVLLVGYLTYHLVLIFLGLYFFMFIFLISFTWIVKSLKGEINYYILIPRMFKSKKSALQRALLNRKKKKKLLGTHSVPGIVANASHLQRTLKLTLRLPLQTLPLCSNKGMIYKQSNSITVIPFPRL